VRLAALLRSELLIQWRYGFVAVLGGLAAVWTALLLALDVPDAGPYVLFVETVTGGTLIAGALAAADATTAAAAALRVTPARPAELVASRLSTLVLVTVAAAVPVLLASGAAGRLTAALVGTALAALLLLALALAVAARRDSFLGFLTVAPWPMVPLIAVPLAASAGLLDGGIWYAVPTTGFLAVLRGAAPYPSWLLLGYLALWSAAAVWLAVRAAAGPGPSTRVDRAAPGRSRPLTGRWVRLRADLRNMSRDALLLPVLASPLLLGLAARFGYPPLESWVDGEYGVDLTPHRPVVALLTVLLHVPVVFGMLGALLLLDDHDTGALRVIRVSPLGVPRHVAGRLAMVSVATVVGLLVAAPLSGLVPATAWAAVLLAVPAGPLFALAVLAAAGDRVRGLAVAKVFGLPAYLPLAAWWLPPAAGWPLAVLPGFWVLRVWDGAHPGWLLGGALCAAAWCAVLLPAVRARWW
jgi:fluoroquinolone transport system permease protein